MMTFGPEITQILDNAYRGADITRRRLANFSALDPHPADTIVDIGCGPGWLTVELARAVGRDGTIIAVDPSPDMRDAATDRCADHPNVQIIAGEANALPLPNSTADRAVSVQVFEYLIDIPGALAESHRVLRPGGRLVIGDIHFDTWAWHSDDPARMARVIAAWDNHLTERCVPALLPAMLHDAQFVVRDIATYTCCDATLRPDGLAMMLLHIIPPYIVRKGLISKAEAEAWAAEQHELAAAGRFFFSLTHIITTARKA